MLLCSSQALQSHASWAASYGQANSLVSLVVAIDAGLEVLVVVVDHLFLAVLVHLFLKKSTTITSDILNHVYM